VDALIAVETTLKDSSIRSEENKVRDTLYTVNLCRLSLAVEDLRPSHTKLSCSVDRNLNMLTLPNCDAYNLEFLTTIDVIDSLDVRNLALARATPWRPEVKKNIFSFTNILGKLNFLVNWLWRNAASKTYNVVHCEILEHFTLCCLKSCAQSVLHALDILVLLNCRRKKVKK
jgi:hypothetical protein